MRKSMPLGVLALLFALWTYAAGPPAKKPAYLKSFKIAAEDFASAGRNTYFILEPGYVLYFTGTEGGQEADLRVSVLSETKIVGGVETRVVEEREMVKGVLSEVSRNYFAISKTTHDVYYFGEEVDNYRDGRLENHEGSWLAGEKNYRFGLAMPSEPKIGVRYYQEVAPGAAMDRAEIVSLDGTMTTPAGKFEHVLKTRESSPLEPGGKEFKYYAPGIGLIKDGGLILARCGPQAGH